MPNHTSTEDRSEDTFSFIYRFEFDNGKSYEYPVIIRSDTLESVNDVPSPPPPWAMARRHCRETCQLHDERYCPAALRLVIPVEMFKDVSSYVRVKVTVISQERDYTSVTDLQNGLRSLFGLLLATSGCPTMELFKAMARFHLPFSTLEETTFRIASTELLRQYFDVVEGTEPHIDKSVLTNLIAMYEAVAIVNKGLAAQVSEVFQNESSVNAVVILDAFSVMVPMSVEDNLEELKRLMFGE